MAKKQLEVRTVDLRDGDSVTIAVTAMVKINGDDTWVKVESTSTVQEETGKEAHGRLMKFVAGAFKKSVFDVVDLVEEMQP